MSKKSCEAAESAESAILRMARVNCNDTIELRTSKEIILCIQTPVI